MPTQESATSTQDGSTQTTTPDGAENGASSASASDTTATAGADTSGDGSGTSADSNGVGTTTSSSDTSGTTANAGTAGTAADAGTTADSSDSGTDASTDADAGTDGSGTATASNGSGSTQAQTPAAQLKVDPIQPISLDPDQDLVAASTSADSPVATDTTSSDTAQAASETSGGDVSNIIAVGTTVAKIMAASAPDYSMRSSPAAVLPKDADPLSLAGVVADPQEMRMPLNYRNGLPSGVDLVFNLPIVVQWRFGGSYKGTGRYITGASMFLDSGTDTGAFYKVDVDASFANAFTSSSPAGPVAGIDLLISIKVTDSISPAGLVVVLSGTIHGDGSGKMMQRP